MEAGDKSRTLNASNCDHALQSQRKLKIGLIGFGNFTQFLAKTMIKQGHSVIATSRSDYTQLCQKMGIRFLRVLSHLDLEFTPINTKGYETLLRLTENTVSDSFDLYYGLFMYNINTTEQMEKLDRAFEAVKQKLFGRLHEVLRKQLMIKAAAASLKSMPGAEPSITSSHTSTRHVKDLSSFIPAKMSSSAELREESGPLKQFV